MRKSVLIIVLAVGIFVGIVYGQTTNRNDLYRHWGPVLLEAVVLVTKDEINILRSQHGLPPRTNQQIMDALKSKVDGLSAYPWMTERPGME